MLRLIDVCKSYKYGKNKVKVLDNINIDFKKNEMVFILGNSGSGKSTLLNIIGGLLDVDSGNVMLDDRDVTKFNNSMLCNYRNNMIGYIFQDYHLIEYMSVIDNIKLGMTISLNNKNNVEDVLKKLGIYNKRNMKVNKLSGGEKQRVAIARAIINDPEIILCDEPTGALDSSNSILIMNILKELSLSKLVIVVSHDRDLADKYADRTINIVDGKINYEPIIDENSFRKIGKKKIKLFQIIKLAIKNLGLRKGRTLFTSLAISISLVCLLLVLCLSRSFNDDIDKLERDVVSKFPVSIYNGEFEIDSKDIVSSNTKIINKNKKDYIHTNKINDDYLDFIKKIDNISYIGYIYDISMPLVSDRYKILNNSYMKMLPSDNFISNNYEILAGNNISSFNEILLKVDSNNNVSSELLGVFNIDNDLEYEELIGRKLKVILNDLYYSKRDGYYFINNNYKELYNKSNVELEVVGIVRERDIIDDRDYFLYSSKLLDYVIEKNSKSNIVVDQINNNYNLLGIDMNKDEILSYLGYKTMPIGIDIYVSNLDNKNILLDMLDEYNKGYNKLIYVDTMNDAINILKDIIKIITVILIIFSMISIIVSSLMVLILTNNRMMERVREVGILRSLGARSEDISRLFNIENLIIGIISSLIGIIIIKVSVSPINSIMKVLLDDGNLFKIYSELVLFGIIFNMFIIVVSGYIPIKIFSNKKYLK